MVTVIIPFYTDCSFIQRQCRPQLNADPGRKERHLQKEKERWRQEKKTSREKRK